MTEKSQAPEGAPDNAAVMRQALEALEYMHREKCDYMRRNNLGDPLRETATHLALPAISALRAALAAQPQATREYRQANPLGGPAKVFRAMADAIEAGDSYEDTLRRFEYAEARPAPAEGDAPTGAIINGRVYADRLEQTGLQCEAGPLTMCSDWHEFRRCFEYLADWAQAHVQPKGLTPNVEQLAAMAGQNMWMQYLAVKEQSEAGWEEVKRLAAERDRLSVEVSALRDLAATCYAGLGGECDLPENWLDALNAAANGEPFSTDGLLPFTATQAPAPAHDRVPMPQNADQAVGMVLLGEHWLREHAPERLKQAPAVGDGQ